VLSSSFSRQRGGASAAAAPQQTMKAFLPILLRFAFFVIFASAVAESLRS
jgi:hypothetical protein